MGWALVQVNLIVACYGASGMGSSGALPMVSAWMWEYGAQEEQIRMNGLSVSVRLPMIYEGFNLHLLSFVSEGYT
jgi:hypothetical protein